MITAFSHTTIWVLDQDEALDFYTSKLGFEVRTDERIDDFRWLTVSPPSQPDHELILLEPGPPMMDEETARQVRALVAKGVLGPGAFETEDCQGTYEQFRERGANFLSEVCSFGFSGVGERRGCQKTKAAAVSAWGEDVGRRMLVC
jgi:catechol 2,3-dioxygenase-like lactoylglutathione lyase family enzyme